MTMLSSSLVGGTGSAKTRTMMMMLKMRQCCLSSKKKTTATARSLSTSTPTSTLTAAATAPSPASVPAGARRSGKYVSGSTASLINRFDPPPTTTQSPTTFVVGRTTTRMMSNNCSYSYSYTYRCYKSTLAMEVVTDTTQQEQQQQEKQTANSAAATTSSKADNTATAPHGLSVTRPFPSLVITSSSSSSEKKNGSGGKGSGGGEIIPQGSFAQSQAQFLEPDLDTVHELRDALLKTNVGIVAHYYMDVELQGILQALKESHPTLANRVGIADSLKMGDIAVEMCKTNINQEGGTTKGGGVDHVICLGVDFMAESVQAIMNKNGYGHVPVYRATPQAIGCSLAESAESKSYKAWLQQESRHAVNDGCNPLHVIYINTSLETKATSSSLVPTITCTSSNVLQTLLQSSSEIPNLRVLYGPDTYMGENLERLLEVIIDSDEWTDTKIQTELHKAHTNETLKTLRDNLRVFPQGNCVVHHMFGRSVVDQVKKHYTGQDTFVTAHLEVPGEMFDIAMNLSLQDKGVVGSTSDILTFITRKVQEAVSSNNGTSDGGEGGSEGPRRLRFVLGTEAGMVSSIVKNVKEVLAQANAAAANVVEAEIVFPVSSDAVMATDSSSSGDGGDDEMPLVPGVAGGEGCSTAGGCATCPFMKMNSLESVQDILDMVDQASSGTEQKLRHHLPPDRLTGKSIDGQDAVELGTEAILFMRGFMQSKSMPKDLVDKVVAFK
mmetsp:Transcript_28131/g.68405  ORF Transcript_28131/g.68405 Transcript_28131/m.68405 type:complete len:724 (-) Transcript_28131:754-2925(-)|eukprot:CAMPEP_0113493896 /NCGR_PEP_ID=MMETSP0014_2-20120614/28829_1 /TAXON_ID=2857 /ORGANISM="Nitzschia sp." /LENGTH=723 /DNA_ID=CAMNT_0000387775 /DNA_START=291 /DNA_END=2462 /DNA_ORIENTATION=+ /assembly_acc=CAM_ASM_000159